MANSREYNREYYQRDRLRHIAETRQRQKLTNDKVVALKLAKGCEKCGYKKCARALQYHHLRDKKYEVAKMVAQGRSMTAIYEEIAKCILVCANCHAEIHDMDP